MKKILFLFLLLLAVSMPTTLKAEVVVIGDTNATTTQYTLPVNMFFNYSLTQQIYTAEEIGLQGIITSISFEYTNSASFTMNGVQVYMKNVDKASFSSNTDMVAVTPDDKVFEGTISATGAGWVTLNLNTPFVYDGESNLLVCFYDPTSGYPGSAYKWRTTATTDTLGIAYYSDSYTPSLSDMTTFSGSKAIYKYRANIKIELTPGEINCHAVSNLNVTNITSTNASVVWAPSVDAGNYILQYKTATQTWDDDEVVTDYPYDTTYDFSDMLSATTSYNVRVANMCSNGDTSVWRSVTFKTSCAEIEELPLIINFDDVTGSTSGTTNNLPDCWNYINTGTSSTYIGLPNVNNTASNANSGSNSLRFYTYVTAGTYGDQIAILPPIDANIYPINTLQISFGARRYSTYTLNLVVGVMTNPDDMATFVPIDTITTSSSTYSFYDIPLDSYTGTGNYIALKAPQPTSSYNSGYVDDIEVNLIPACSRPSNLSQVGMDLTTATLTWESTGSIFNVYYKTMNDTVYTVIEDVYLDGDNTYTVDNLSPSSIYEWYVVALCEDGSELACYTTAMFRTECGVISDFPWFEGFESEWTAVDAFNQSTPTPNCWKIFNGGATSSTYNWTWRYNTTAARVFEGHSSACCYTDYATEAHNDWLITPMIQFNGNQMVTFYAQRATATTTEPDEISIWISEPDAVLVAPDSTNDPLPGFTEVWQSDIPVGAFQRYDVSLADYSGNRYIAFVRRNEPYNGYWLALDNVEVGDIPECAAPNTLLSSDPTSNSVVLSWLGNTTAYNLYYREVGDTTYTMEANVTLTDDTYLLTGLDNSTAYEWYVAALCTDGTEIPSFNTAQFTTLCETITQLPVFWDFEASNPLNQMPLCWSVLNQGSSGPKVQFNANNAYHGSGLLYLYNNNPHSTLILPPFDASSNPVNTLQLRFFAMNMGTYPAWDVVVTGGVMTDPSDASTFTAMDSIHVVGEAGGAYTEYTLSFTQYEGEGEYIALQFYTVSGSQWLRVDDMTLEVAPSCSAPDSLTMVSSTTSSVTLTWQSDATDMTLYYKALSDQEYTVVENVSLDADGSYTISDLSSSTDYSWYLAVDCGDGTVATSSFASFNTLCDVITELPWFEGFESTWHATAAFGQENDAPQCWKIYDGGATSSSYVWKWKYNNTAGRVYEGTSSAVCYTDYATSNHNDWLISPLIQLDGNQQVSFYAQRASTTTSEPDEISIWISDEDAELIAPDTTTAPLPGFTQVYQTDIPSGAFQQYVVSLYGYTGNRYIAFVRRNAPNDGYYLSLDNVMVSNLPDCAEPSNIQLLSISTTEATVSWSSNASSFNLYYKETSDSVWNEEFGITLDEQGAYTLMNLTPSTSYQWYVEAVCSDTNLASPIQTFNTLCEDMNIPYTENFNNYSVSVSAVTTPSNYPNDVLPSCWSFLNRSTTSSAYPQAFLTSNTSYAASGNCLFFKSSNSTPLYAVMPHFTDALNTLQITFTYRNEGTTAYNGTLSLGYMTDLTDVSTFTELHSYAKTTTLTEVTEILSNIPDEVASGFLVFKYTGGSGSNYYLSIDNVLVETISTCPRPSDVISTDATSNSITLAWTANGDETAWEIAYGSVGFDPDDNSANIVTATTNPFEVQNLQTATSYEFYVRAICSSTEMSSWSNAGIGTTECDVVTTLPYSENFDSISAGSESAFPICWARPVQYNGYPFAVTAQSHSTPASLRFTSLTTTPTTAVTPQFAEDIHNLSLNFWLKAESTTSSGTFEVGVLTNPLDTSTFVGVLTIQPASTAWTEYTIDFDTTAVSGPNKYIGFRQHSNSSVYYYWLDDVVVSSNGSGPVVTDPTVTTAAANPIAQTTATLNATIANPDNVSISAKGFEWKTTMGGTYTQIAGTGTGNSFTANLTGLTANTGYTYKAFITYNGTTVYGSEITFTTLPEEVEPCEVPTGLTASNITKESFDVSWNAISGVNNWNIRYRVAGGQWTTATSNTNQYAVTGLTAETNYEVQVQADCGDGNLSEWSASLNVTTLVDGINSYLLNSIAVFPNPANDVVNVQCTMNNVQLEGIEVIDVYGKVVRTVVGANNYSPIRINVSGLAAGMYFVRVTTDEGVVTKTFVKR